MTKQELNNKTIIRNISFDQSEILHNIMELYTDGRPYECDITASSLAFYRKTKGDKYEIPTPRILMDCMPQRDDIIKITPFNKLPLEDNSIESIVVDLPFVISPKSCKSVVEKKDGANLTSNRFSSWYPAREGYENMYWWIKECYRVLKPGGVCVYKIQSTISGGKFVPYAQFSFMAAQDAGFYFIDEFILEAQSRLIAPAKYKKQAHARKFTSSFFVLKKDDKIAASVNCFSILNDIKRQETEGVFDGKVWPLK